MIVVGGPDPDAGPDRAAESARDWRAAHGAQVAAALDSGDPAAIRRLYTDLGDLLETSYADDIGGVPQLSLPETIPVATGLLEGVSGVLLDAGCGPNPVAAVALARAGADRTIVGLDLGFGTVRLARARAADAGIVLFPVVADLERLPLRTDAVSGVVCDDTIEHVPDDGAAVRELCRVTNHLGRVVLATPNRHSLAVLVRRARDVVRGRRRSASAYFVADSHLREYTWRELARLVGPAAAIDRRVTVGWSGGWLRRAASWLTSRRALRTLDRMLVVRLVPRS